MNSAASELAKLGIQKRREKLGGRFNEYMREIAKKPRKRAKKRVVHSS